MFVTNFTSYIKLTSFDVVQTKSCVNFPKIKHPKFSRPKFLASNASPVKEADLGVTFKDTTRIPGARCSRRLDSKDRWETELNIVSSSAH